MKPERDSNQTGWRDSNVPKEGKVSEASIEQTGECWQQVSQFEPEERKPCKDSCGPTIEHNGGSVCCHCGTPIDRKE